MKHLKYIKAELQKVVANKETAEQLKLVLDAMKKEIDELEYQANVILNHANSVDQKDLQSIGNAYDAMKRPLLELEKNIKDFRKARGINY